MKVVTCHPRTLKIPWHWWWAACVRCKNRSATPAGAAWTDQDKRTQRRSRKGCSLHTWKFFADSCGLRYLASRGHGRLRCSLVWIRGWDRSILKLVGGEKRGRWWAWAASCFGYVRSAIVVLSSLDLGGWWWNVNLKKDMYTGECYLFKL